MHQRLYRKILSVLLSVLGWFFAISCSAGYQLALWQLHSMHKLDNSEWAIATVKSTVPMIAVGALMLWGAKKLWARWWLATAIVGFIFGILPFLEMQAVFGPGVASGSLLINLLLAAALLVAAKYGTQGDKGQRPQAGHSVPSGASEERS